MKESLYKKDWENLRAAAHSILPSFSTMGMSEDYAQMAREIQELAEKKENLEKVKELLTKMEAVCEQAYKELQEEMLTLK